MIEFHRIFCKIAANTGTVWTQWVVQECWRISVLQKIRQWNSFFVPLSFFMFLWILDTFSWYNSKLRPTCAFSFHDKWFKFQLRNKASRLVLRLWVADAYNDINGFSSFCFDRMFHRSKWNTIHIGHWDIIETTGRCVCFTVLVFIINTVCHYKNWKTITLNIHTT